MVLYRLMRYEERDGRVDQSGRDMSYPEGMLSFAATCADSKIWPAIYWLESNESGQWAPV